MGKNRNNARIWGADLEGGVYEAPKGTVSPDWDTELTEPGAPWVEFGWLGDDGVDFEQDTDSSELKAWPTGLTLRKVTTSLTRTWKFLALEENAHTLGFVHPGLTFEETGPDSGIFKGTVPANHRPEERAAIFFFKDGEHLKAAVCPVVTLELTSAVPHKFDDLTAYEFTATTIGEYDIYIVADADDFLGSGSGG